MMKLIHLMGMLAMASAPLVHADAIQLEIHPAETETYAVKGRTLHEAATSMGSGHVALTRWRVAWKYSLEGTTACRLKSFHVDVTTKFRMPRWVDRDSAPMAARKSWDTFFEAIKRHEEGHREHGEAAGREIAREVRALSPRGDCRATRAELDRIGSAAVARYKERDDEYDRMTRHGISQGAILR
jgi:predicted secreted Zn-dependent protease